MKTLYKRTSSGKIQTWRQEVEGSQFRTITGQIDGAETVGAWTQAQPKNIGKANERTAEQQAVFEVAANYQKKLEKDYWENIADIDRKRFFSPMLAEKYPDYQAKMWAKNKMVYLQPKLDGMRCVTHKHGQFSRNGKPVLSAPHLLEASQPVLEYLEKNYGVEIPLDGELYNHALKADFDELMSILKKSKNLSPDVLAKSRELAQLHIFDIGMVDVPFSTRLHIIENELRPLFENDMIKFVHTTYAESHEQVEESYLDYLEDGYEGGIVRVNSHYVNKRTQDLLKRVDLLTDEFELVDLQPGIGAWADKARIATFRMPNGETFDANVAGTMLFCAEALANKAAYIGTQCTVIFRMYTPKGKPRFGRVKEFDRQDA